MQALVFWRDLGLQGLTCIHVDAHLDVQDSGLSPELMSQFLDGVPPQDLRGTPELPWGGLHCGNYLYPALVSGLVSHLVWVVPPHLLEEGQSLLSWAREEVGRWVDLTLEEWSGLRAVSSAQVSPDARVTRVEGTLCGQRFTLCLAEGLPALEGPVALDIDVDYFVRPDDSLWSSPESLAQQLQGLTVEILTVATSLEGGYTPANQHGLGQDCLRCFGFPQHPLPLHYRPQPEDLVWREIHRDAYGLALELLEACAPGPVHLYLESIVQARLNNPDRAYTCLLQLEQSVPLTGAELAQVLFMRAETLAAQHHQPAIRLLRRALEHAAHRYDIRFSLARRLRDAGQFPMAARTLRAVLQQSQNRVSGLEHELELARTYAQMGQTALAQATHRQLQARDVLGLQSMHSLLDQAYVR
ncbi:hypothetical protein IV102_18005 [bacterium]|nr:hypothetical protein [bacterium]